MSRVLVVEDETLIRLTAVELITEAGHEVIEAGNADEAVRILESRSDIDVVFSDMNMPGSMDGLRLMHVIRWRWPPIRLILVSGRKLGADATLPEGAVFVAKPYGPEQVSEALARAA